MKFPKLASATVAGVIVGFSGFQISQAEANEEKVEISADSKEFLESLNYNDDDTVYLDESFKSQLSSDQLQFIDEHFEMINEGIKNGDLEPVDTGEGYREYREVGDEDVISIQNTGNTSYTIEDWGVTMLMDDRAATSFAQDLQTLGGGTVSASLISRYIPSPPTQLVSIVAGAFGGGAVAIGERVSSQNDGSGVEIRVQINNVYVYSR